MVIGIDVRDAAPELRTGKGRVAYETLPLMAKASPKDEWLLFSKRKFDWDLPPNCRWRILPGKGPLWHRRVASAANRAADVYFAPTSYITPRFLKIPTVVFVHDLLAFARGTGVRWRWRLVERITLRSALRKAARLVTNSEATAADMKKKFGRTPPIAVAPLAADRFRRPGSRKISAVKKKFRIPERYVLIAGTIEPRKNHARLIEAFSGLPAKTRERTALVIAGRWGWKTRGIKRALAKSKGTKVVEGPNDQELAALYAGATVFAYPSLLEGFGLPVLEAMKAEVPVLTSDAPALREVAGEAAEYCHPYSVVSIRTALAGLLQSAPRRSKLGSKGAARARKFSWKRTADLILPEIRSAGGRRKA